MESGSLDGRQDGEHIGVVFMEISMIFAEQDTFSFVEYYSIQYIYVFL